MNKELVIKLLKSTQVDLNDLNEFVTEYTHEKLNRDITAVELAGIVQAIQMRAFDLRYALMEAARILDLNVINVPDKNGNHLYTHVYESF